MAHADTYDDDNDDLFATAALYADARTAKRPRVCAILPTRRRYTIATAQCLSVCPCLSVTSRLLSKGMNGYNLVFGVEAFIDQSAHCVLREFTYLQK